MRLLIGSIIFLSVCISSCKKTNPKKVECAVSTIVPFQPYSDPVWHPDGRLLGFNHIPLANISINGTAPCTWYNYFGRIDSIGFYLMNKDGTALRRETNFILYSPSWSPDGNWIAFKQGADIYKIHFDGVNLDTTHITRLTSGDANYCYPNWTADSDTLYYDSNVGTNGQGYYIWKMASDGSGKTGFPNTGREPYAASDGNIYFVRGASGQPEIFLMKKDGSNVTQVTFNGKNGLRRTPKYWQGRVFYQEIGLWYYSTGGTVEKQLTTACETYDISKGGEIVYGMFDYGILDRIWGTLWIVNADGSNKKQLTFNNY